MKMIEDDMFKGYCNDLVDLFVLCTQHKHGWGWGVGGGNDVRCFMPT